MELKQYHVVLVNLDPTVGSEIKKTRPCLIISPDEMNRNLRTIIIAPLTSSSKNYPTRVKVSQNYRISWVVLDQIKTIDKSRIIKSFDSIAPKEIANCNSVLKETFVD